MAKTAVIQLRVDPDIKQKSQELFGEMGLTTSDAINLFLIKCLNEKSIPFQMSSSAVAAK